MPTKYKVVISDHLYSNFQQIQPIDFIGLKSEIVLTFSDCAT